MLSVTGLPASARSGHSASSSSGSAAKRSLAANTRRGSTTTVRKPSSRAKATRCTAMWPAPTISNSSGRGRTCTKVSTPATWISALSCPATANSQAAATVSRAVRVVTRGCPHAPFVEVDQRMRGASVVQSGKEHRRPLPLQAVQDRLPHLRPKLRQVDRQRAPARQPDRPRALVLDAVLQAAGAALAGQQAHRLLDDGRLDAAAAQRPRDLQAGGHRHGAAGATRRGAPGGHHARQGEPRPGRVPTAHGRLDVAHLHADSTGGGSRSSPPVAVELTGASERPYGHAGSRTVPPARGWGPL